MVNAVGNRLIIEYNIANKENLICTQFAKL